MLTRETTTWPKITRLFFKLVMKHHGLSKVIVFDGDMKFISKVEVRRHFGRKWERGST